MNMICRKPTPPPVHRPSLPSLPTVVTLNAGEPLSDRDRTLGAAERGSKAGKVVRYVTSLDYNVVAGRNRMRDAMVLETVDLLFE